MCNYWFTFIFSFRIPSGFGQIHSFPHRIRSLFLTFLIVNSLFRFQDQDDGYGDMVSKYIRLPKWNLPLETEFRIVAYDKENFIFCYLCYIWVPFLFISFSIFSCLDSPLLTIIIRKMCPFHLVFSMSKIIIYIYLDQSPWQWCVFFSSLLFSHPAYVIFT